MKDIIYVKYSNQRDDAYKIKTVILQDEDGNQYVEKHALTEISKKHIVNIVRYGKQLNQCAKATKFRFNNCTAQNGILNCEYIKGETLSSILTQKGLRKDFTGVLELVKEFFAELNKMATEPFFITEEFTSIFGNAEFDCEQKSCPITDFDMILSNILVCDDDWHVIDYEWTYEFPIPVKFLMYRAILSAEPTIRQFLEENTQLLGISEKEIQVFLEMESHFQLYVKGQEICLSDLYYLQKRSTINQLLSEKEQVIAEKEQVIAEKEQVIAEKEQVIAEKEQVIAARDNIIQIQANQLQELTAHIKQIESVCNDMANSKSWKITKPLRDITQLLRSKK